MLPKIFVIICLALSYLVNANIASAQDSVKVVTTNKLSQEIAIPFLENAHFTPFHAYFSTTEGKMILYRVQENGLQYLFENESFGQRGPIISSDFRFAYALTNDLQLTVIDPNSLLLVHNVLQLADSPLLVKRFGDRLMVIDASGVTMYSTKIVQDSSTAPEQVVSWQEDGIISAAYVDRTNDSDKQQLWALSATNRLFNYEVKTVDNTFELDLLNSWEITTAQINGLLYANNNLAYAFNSDSNELFRVEGGIAKRIAEFDSAVLSLNSDTERGNSLLAVTASNQLFRVFVEDPLPKKLLLNAGSTIQLFQHFEHYWIRQGNRVYLFDAFLNKAGEVEDTSMACEVEESERWHKQAFDRPKFGEKLRFVHPAGVQFLAQLPLLSGWQRDDLFFELTSKTTNTASLEGQTFVWKPSLTEVGLHQFVAKVFDAQGIQDSIAISFEIRPFNEPPTFLPSRLSSIVVGEEVQISTKAIDPDGLDRMLLRYRAKDLPKGAVLDPVKGIVVWNPKADQVGKHSFQVIASDQYGASSLQTVQMQVIDLTKEQ